MISLANGYIMLKLSTLINILTNEYRVLVITSTAWASVLMAAYYSIFIAVITATGTKGYGRLILTLQYIEMTIGCIISAMLSLKATN